MFVCLSQAGCSLTARAEDGETPLFYASRNNVVLVDEMVKRGADMNAQSADGTRAAATQVCECSRVPVCVFVSVVEQATPAHVAVAVGNMEVFECLKSRRDMSVINKDGKALRRLWRRRPAPDDPADQPGLEGARCALWRLVGVLFAMFVSVGVSVLRVEWCCAFWVRVNHAC